MKPDRDGSAVTTHRYESAGHYLLRVEHAGKNGKPGWMIEA